MIKSGHSYFLFGLNNRNNRLSSKGIYAKNKLIILVGAAIATSVVIFQAITNNRLLTPSIMGLDAVYLFIKVLPVFLFGIQSVWVTNCIFELYINTYNDGVIRTNPIPRYL